MQEHLFTYNKKYTLELGEQLNGFELSYRTLGSINEDASNIIWVCHALTGNADVADWWSGLFGNKAIFNPDEHFIICVNVIGSCYGSTGPLSINPDTNQPYYSTFPNITIRDMVGTLEILRKELNINKINTLIGGSLGGQQALEWAIQQPDLMENLIICATNASHSPWGIAFNETQRMAIEADPTWGDESPNAGDRGLKAARAIAMLSYRNYSTYEATQSEENNNSTDNFKASTYQQYQGQKLLNRFNAYSYWALSKAMDSHNLGRNRTSIEDSLQKIEAYTQVIGISSDVLFPVSEQRYITSHIKNVTYEEISSLYGHDGFLVETHKIAAAIRAFFKQKKKKKISTSI
ncbi:homoserine O-acetyltransferase family protein [Flammeovirga kamogawensis]|uniref:Homoserine O-acetyltransferase n=1 Tax=Flammeovirga kamogawensis TaxID=373891 RepID=A0ABX8GWC5_9BACT|nr:homoserine O-acetyltransferase [Flammeovirga kamogawensis]MBB6461641.1 homoserine O-acetyltransferase [Flammeovirga kamogawensis]QWG07432.1 homoserine O-acetyltransferase [Flammeovirga kamogawensis]TRX69243.1 homoserine O-acetyltransferase [Flammeovirga kamogawensis]